jgi:D-alanyl-D-alanine carboxypeptidase
MRGRRATTALVVLALVGAAGSSASRQGPSRQGPSSQGFHGSVAPISPALAQEMTGVSWRPGCPVALRDLRVVTATHHGFDGRDHTGRLIVHREVALQVLTVLRRLYADGFPIRRMVPVDAFAASDFRSIEADNTSAFNCRFVDGTTRYSEHAYGKAIDVNPIENPFVTSAGTTSHAASRPYLRRTPFRPGMASAGHSLVRAFDAIGWGWGGRWSGARDYQHFSRSGR